MAGQLQYCYLLRKIKNNHYCSLEMLSQNPLGISSILNVRVKAKCKQ